MNEKSAAGDIEAKYVLALAYFDGAGVEADEEKAIVLLAEAAAAGHPKAMRAYANRLLDGVGVPQDQQAGMAMLTKAAEAGDASAQGDLGICYFYGDGTVADYNKALFWLEKSASQGDMDAQAQLAEAYSNPPDGIEPDYEKAFALNSEAAAKGSLYARESLASAYADGIGTAANPEKALEMFLSLAGEGSRFAMRWLGIYYSDGEHTEENLELAKKWFSKAAELKDAQSMKSLGFIYQDEWQNNHSSESFTQAEKWLSDAVEAGEYGACGALGDIYIKRGQTGDKEKAEELLRQGAEEGYIYPAFRLARVLLDNGRSSDDFAEGRKWLEFAAENGDTNAMHTLSICYNEGRFGFPIDRVQSFKWMKEEGENSEDPSVWFLLACAYNEGDGTQKNYEQAFIWYKKAADAGVQEAYMVLAELYARGLGTVPDMDKARICIASLRKGGTCGEESLNNMELLLPAWEIEGRANANPNDLDAQKDYAISLLNLNVDSEKAIDILERCGEAGHLKSQQSLYYFFQKGYPEDGSIIHIDQNRANYWLEKSAACGEIWAWRHLYSNYKNGFNGYPKDAEKAFYWVDRVLKQDANNPEAQALAGTHYLDGEGVARDMERGIELVRSSAQAGVGYGQYIYGRLFHLGGGSIQKDLTQAEYWMQTAVKNGWEGASKELEEVRRELAESSGFNDKVRNYCSHCGTKLTPGAVICGSCGTRVGEVPADSSKGHAKRSKHTGLVPLIFSILTLLITLRFNDWPYHQRRMIFVAAPVFLWILITKLKRPVDTKKLNIGLLLSGIALAVSVIGMLTGLL